MFLKEISRQQKITVVRTITTSLTPFRSCYSIMKLKSCFHEQGGEVAITLFPCNFATVHLTNKS